MRDVSRLNKIRDELGSFGATIIARKMRENRLRPFRYVERRNNDEKVRVEIRVEENRERDRPKMWIEFIKNYMKE